MKRFEYKILCELTDHKMNLNHWGNDGWEAYAAVPGSNGCVRHYLKRELPEETKDN